MSGILCISNLTKNLQQVYIFMASERTVNSNLKARARTKSAKSAI